MGSASPNRRPSTNHGYLSAPPSATTSSRGTRKNSCKNSRKNSCKSTSNAPKPKGLLGTPSYLALGSSKDDVMSVLQGLGLSRHNSDVSQRGRSGSLNPKVTRQRSERMFNELSELMIMDSSRDLTNIDPSTCYRSRKRPAPIKRQSSDLSSLQLDMTPRQSDVPDPDIQAVLDNLPILWEQNKSVRWSQCDDEEMFKPNVSFKSLVHVAKWCQQIRNRVKPQNRRGSI